MSILDEDHPDLATRIGGLSGEQAKKAAVAISQLAVSRSKLNNLLVDQTLQDLAGGANITDSTIDALYQLYDKLQKPYLEVLGPDKDGYIDETAETQFQQALAVKSVADAASGNLHDAADNALAYLEPDEIEKFLSP